MALLNGVLALHDVRDAEKLVRSVLVDGDRRRGSRLSVDEDAVAWMIETCWILSKEYEHKGSGESFSTFATRRLRLRVVDYIRLREGRTKWQYHWGTYERERRPIPLSLDAPANDEDGGESPLVELIAAGWGDPAAGGDPDLLDWLDETGNCEAESDSALVCRLVAGEADRRARERAERARGARQPRPPRAPSPRRRLAVRIASELGVSLGAAHSWIAGRQKPKSLAARAKLEALLAELELEPAA